MKTCPFNYSGSKSDYYFFHDINIPIVDLFSGGGGIWSNVKSNDIIVNDKQKDLIELQKFIYESSDEEFDKFFKDVYSIANSINSRESFEKIRYKFNFEKRCKVIFYSLILTSTKNMIRFNSKNNINSTWDGHRNFNKKMQEKIINFRNRIKQKNIQFNSVDFENLKFDKNKYTLIVDPPYLLSMAAYNNYWTINDEKRLYNFLSNKNFCMTNIIKRDEKTNEILISAIKKYKWIFKEIEFKNNKAARKKTNIKEIIIFNSVETSNNLNLNYEI